jgi:hypothetical protein
MASGETSSRLKMTPNNKRPKVEKTTGGQNEDKYGCQERDFVSSHGGTPVSARTTTGRHVREKRRCRTRAYDASINMCADAHEIEVRP